MKKSPCKKCKKHKTEFPYCINECKTLDQIQNVFRRSYDHSVKTDYDATDELDVMT